MPALESMHTEDTELHYNLEDVERTPDAVVAPKIPALAPALDASPVLSASPKKQEKKHRTTGMRIFDTLLYPILTNTGVFGLSVIFTYLTEHGGEKVTTSEIKNTAEKAVELIKDGEKRIFHPNEMIAKTEKHTFGKFGKFMAKRGKWMDDTLMDFGMSQNAAKMSRFVFFSFADGTLFAPLVKKFEDHRNGISRKIDGMLGTTPNDTSVYQDEPKQSWKSVVLGRFFTALIVVPTAVLLENITPFGLKSKKVKNADGVEVKEPIEVDGKVSFEHEGAFGKTTRAIFNHTVMPVPVADAEFAKELPLYKNKLHNDTTTKATDYLYTKDANINDLLFNKFGADYGNRIDGINSSFTTVSAKPTIREHIDQAVASLTRGMDKFVGTKINKVSLFKIVAFEAFYTSVCTTGLYILSRTIARKDKKEDIRDFKALEEKEHVLQQPVIVPDVHVSSVDNAAVQTPSDVPSTKISAPRVGPTVGEVLDDSVAVPHDKNGWSAQKTEAKPTHQDLAHAAALASFSDKEKIRTEHPAAVAQI